MPRPINLPPRAALAAALLAFSGYAASASEVWRPLAEAGLGEGAGVCSGADGEKLCFGLRCAEGFGKVGAAWFLLSEDPVLDKDGASYVGLAVAGGGVHRLTMRPVAAIGSASLLETPLDSQAQAGLLADLETGEGLRPHLRGAILGSLPLDGAKSQIARVLSLCAGPDGRS